MAGRVPVWGQETSKYQTSQQKQFSKVRKLLQFPNAVVLKGSRTQNHANVRKRAQMCARERKCKPAKECKRARKGAKERFRIKIANNQVWNNQVWELPKIVNWEREGRRLGT